MSLAKEFKEFAVKGNEAFVLEANPRGSRTVPFISKASGIPLAKIAARVMMGATLDELRQEGVLVYHKAAESDPTCDYVLMAGWA